MNKILPLICKDCFWVWGDRRHLRDIVCYGAGHCPICRNIGTVDIATFRYTSETNIIKQLKSQTGWDNKSKLPESEKRKILKENAEMVTLEFEL